MAERRLVDALRQELRVEWSAQEADRILAQMRRRQRRRRVARDGGVALGLLACAAATLVLLRPRIEPRPGGGPAQPAPIAAPAAAAPAAAPRDPAPAAAPHAPVPAAAPRPTLAPDKRPRPAPAPAPAPPRPRRSTSPALTPSPARSAPEAAPQAPPQAARDASGAATETPMPWADPPRHCFRDAYRVPVCTPEKDLVEGASGSCARAGMALGPYVLPPPCGPSAYRGLQVICCEPARLARCSVQSWSEPACQPREWFADASRRRCAQLGLRPQTAPLLFDRCPDGGFQSARFLCCP